MDGIHDLGGVQGFGTVPHTNNSLTYKPVFHEDWEHLAYSLLFLAADGLKNFSVDELRHAIDAHLLRADQVHAELGEILAGVKQGRTSPSQITIADLTGVGFQDTAIASAAIRALA